VTEASLGNGGVSRRARGTGSGNTFPADLPA